MAKIKRGWDVIYGESQILERGWRSIRGGEREDKGGGERGKRLQTRKGRRELDRARPFSTIILGQGKSMKTRSTDLYYILKVTHFISL